ncbi:hypothetical protein F4777DRAFT_341693 [Nemania sp. FL0916]|nr:hypothetical protein F4777DRAFT_341693 [Nemania sp. FL0916]
MSGSLRATQVHAPESFPQVSRDPTSAPVFIFPSMGTITNGGNIAQYQNPFQNDNVERVFIPECNLNYFARVDLQSSESTVYQESLTSAVETRPYPYIRPTVRPGEYDPYGGNYASLTVISSTRGPVTIPFTVTPQPPNHQGIGMILGQSYFNAVSDINSMGRLDQIPQAINASHHGMHSQTAQRMAPPTFGDDLVTDFTSTQLPSSTMMSSGSSIGHLDTPSYNNYESLSNGYTYSDASYQDTLPSETNLTFGNVWPKYGWYRR